MRELSLSEMNIVSGAGDDCTGGNELWWRHRNQHRSARILPQRTRA